ncbi:ribose-phosphate pyrophosphokinase [Verrucomicrobia bacterium LW23]|nr:ribose-phosphate pyrophosphokinase [Verrucomicrobia bacterium LW23]
MLHSSQPTPLLFSTRAYDSLCDDVLAHGGLEKGRVEVKDFPDGERYMRILTTVAGRDVALMGGTISDSDTMELYDLAVGLVKFGARSLSLVIPYYAYSTMERAVLPGEIVTAKTRARMFSCIPAPPFGQQAALIDLHSEGIPHYFEGDITPVHLYAKQVVKRAIQRVGGDNYVLASTDAGRAKWVQSLGDELGVDVSFIFKKRLDGERTKISAVSAHVEGKHVVIYDDMIRTGGSLLSAARAYRDAGAISVACVATHALLPGNALEKIRNSGVLTCVCVTDTHPRARELLTAQAAASDASVAGTGAAAPAVQRVPFDLPQGNAFFQVDSVASLIADYLQSV